MCRYLLIVLIFSSSFAMHAQSGLTFFTEQMPGDVRTDSIMDANGNVILQVTEQKQLYVEIKDTLNVHKIEVWLGNTAASNDVLNQQFLFVGQQLSNTLGLIRNGKSMELKLGEWVNREQAHLTLRALSSSGTVVGSYSGMLY